MRSVQWEGQGPSKEKCGKTTKKEKWGKKWGKTMTPSWAPRLENFTHAWKGTRCSTIAVALSTCPGAGGAEGRGPLSKHVQ